MKVVIIDREICASLNTFGISFGLASKYGSCAFHLSKVSLKKISKTILIG